MRALPKMLALVTLLLPAAARAQDSTGFRGVSLIGSYDPHGKVPIAILPIAGAFGDSLRAIVARDLDNSDRFSIVAIDTSDLAAIKLGPAAGLNYSILKRLAAAAAVEITPIAGGVHVVMHDVAKAQVAGVADMAFPANALSRDWRMAVHRTSDEIERAITGKPGIAATRIAYVRGQAIRIVDSDGAAEITVPTEDCGVSPAWNPTGTMLVYATCGADSRIHLIDLATGRSRTLIGPTRNSIYITPTFAPDGQSVLYARRNESQADIFQLPLNQPNAPVRLTGTRNVENTNPVFSPNGNRITYVSGVQGHPELYIMNADGTGADVLTNYDFSDKNYRSDPDWSPDGLLIAYQERINNDRFQLRTIRTTGSTPKQLTSDGENEQPSWAPDSRHLVFTSNRTGVRQLWILDVETNRVRQLTKSSGSKLGSWWTRLGQ
jgi:TolB protein